MITHEDYMTIEAAKQAEINLQKAKDMVLQQKRNLGAIFYKERKRRALSQRHCEMLLFKHGMGAKIFAQRIETVKPKFCYSIPTLITAIETLHQLEH
jgi:hypothetical protein